MANQQPAHVVRIGHLKATIWLKQTKFGDRFSVSLVRVFKDGDRWRESSRFGRDDLLLAAKVPDRAHTWIVEHCGSMGAAAEGNDAGAVPENEH